jgi:ArsR family transcriptional regulator, virulence genes transcriptional regulator
MPAIASRKRKPAPDTAEAMRAHAHDAARLLKALANDSRLMILCLLVAGERSVGEINARIALSQSALSQHLAILRADGLVTTRREAQSIYYGLAPGPAERIIEALHAIYCRPRAATRR